MAAAPLSAQDAPFQPPPRLIDVHMHIWKPLAGGSADSLRAAFTRFNVRKVIASGPIRLALQLRDVAPDLIIGGAVFTESEQLPAVRKLQALFRSGQLGVLGEIDAQYAGVRLDAGWLEPYWAAAEALDVPAAVHTGFGQPRTSYDPYYPRFRAALGNPLYLEDALVRHPKLRVYLMHAGWPFLAETKAILQLYPQVYVDLASFAFNPGIPRAEFYGYLQELLRAGFGRRIMFGSGLSPEDWVQDISRAIRLIDEAPFLTAEQKDDIFYGNAARFLRLPLQ
jgi:predicted TIM-barrel fold metal-dependent hydrolase